MFQKELTVSQASGQGAAAKGQQRPASAVYGFIRGAINAQSCFNLRFTQKRYVTLFPMRQDELTIVRVATLQQAVFKANGARNLPLLPSSGNADARKIHFVPPEKEMRVL